MYCCTAVMVTCNQWVYDVLLLYLTLVANSTKNSKPQKDPKIYTQLRISMVVVRFVAYIYVWQASQYGTSISYGMWRPTACLYRHIIRFEVLYFYFLQQGLRSSSGFWVVCAIYYTRDLSVKTICLFLVSIVLWTVAASWCWAMDEHGEHTAYSYRFLQQYQPCRKKPEIRCSKM